MYYQEYAKVLVSVDVIVFGFDAGKLKILIGKRQLDPGRGEWSLYGGFVGADESLNDAAHRVLFDLTGLRNLYIQQVGTFGSVDRDPGERVISVAYYALINVKDYDDALRQQHNLEWVIVENVPKLYSDHNEMVQMALKLMRTKIKTAPNFRKRVKDMDFIEKTELIDKTTSKRGAYLYRFNKRAYDEDPYFKL